MGIFVDVRAVVRWRCTVGRVLRFLLDAAGVQSKDVVSCIGCAIASGRRARRGVRSIGFGKHDFASDTAA